eukprot:278980_1
MSKQYDNLKVFDNKPDKLEPNISTGVSKGKTVSFDNVIGGICGVWFIFLDVSMIITCVILIVNPSKYEYYHALSVAILTVEVSTILLCIYCCWGFEWNHITQIISLSKFWIQSLGSFVFNCIAFVSIIIYLINNSDDHNKWYYVHALIYLLAAFTVPFPAICIELYHEHRFSNNRERFPTKTSIEPSLTSKLMAHDYCIKHAQISLYDDTDELKSNIQIKNPTQLHPSSAIEMSISRSKSKIAD